MVEFGLKLEDNKVEQWSDKYIDYEKLKSILKKAKAAHNHVEELKKKLPREVVEGCLREFAVNKAREVQFQQEIAQQTHITHQTQITHLQQQQKHNNEEGHNEGNSAHFEISSRSSSSLSPLAEAQIPTDSTPLLAGRRPSFGSNSEQSVAGGGQVALRRQNSWGNFSHTMFRVTSYLGLADEKKVFWMSLEDASVKKDSFSVMYNGEVSSVC
eukprot:CCRYP_011181-RD/>CCRYP_011181-RD protein AED:0.08 eAED:0.08 QI:408/1/1/1/0.9/0.72/11/3644/212